MKTHSLIRLDPPGNRGKSVTWFTPKSLLDSLGAFDLDPCTSIHRPFDTAKRHICLDGGQNGLAARWCGRVWLNPPYGTGMQKWLRKLSFHGNGIALVFARTDTRWAQESMPLADAVCFLSGRIAFLPETPTQQSGGNSSGTPSMLLAFGKANIESLRGLEGWLVERIQ